MSVLLFKKATKQSRDRQHSKFVKRRNHSTVKSGTTDPREASPIARKFEIFPVKSAILNGKIAKKCKKV